jgi:hypothetical protein
VDRAWDERAARHRRGELNGGRPRPHPPRIRAIVDRAPAAAPSTELPLDEPPRRPLPRFRLRWAALAVFLLVLGGGAWYALRIVERLPARVGEGIREQGRAAVEEVGELLRAFRTGTVRQRFEAFTTRQQGTNYLQVVTLDQRQTFEMEDSTTLLWGTVELPPVIVRATAPVQYTYYVDLEGAWRFDLRDDRVLVTAPPLRFNKPAIDVSRMRWQVLQGSLLRDEEVVKEQLRRELMGRAAIQARSNLPQVRETARAGVERFVRNWLLQTFDDAAGYDVEVVFADEAAEVERARRL